MNKPENFAIIIGSMKSGTSYLYDLMIQHPQLLKCSIKEPQYFSYPPIPNPIWEKGMEYYDSLWPDWDSNKHKYAVEASTSYTQVNAYPNAAERIETVEDRSFKFIYIIRNPLERIRSQLTFGTNYHRIRGEFDSKYHENLKDEYIDGSRYAYQLDEYKKRFGRENILILLFEDFVLEPQKSIDKIYEFLSLDSFEVDLERNKNTTGNKAYMPIVYKIRSLIPFQISFQKLIPKFLLKLFRDKDLTEFKLSTEQSVDILDKLRDDIKRLKSEYGVNIERWNLGV